MKKLTILFVLVFLAISLFAEPKVPKYFYDNSDKKEDEFSYISNDLMYCFEILAVSVDYPKFKYKLNFTKRSLVYDTTMSLFIFFETEKQLDAFINNIHLSDIENEFNRIRKQIIMIDEIPNPNRPTFKDEYFDYRNRPSLIFYEADGTKLR